MTYLNLRRAKTAGKYQGLCSRSMGISPQRLSEKNRIHLARIIVAPNQRGRGLGDRLCRLLIGEGLKRFGKVDFTLNVYSENAIAVKLYQKLGFKPKPVPSDSIQGDEIIKMFCTTDPNTKTT